MGEERLWEKSYPPGVRWDAPIEMATLPALFDPSPRSGRPSRPSNIATARRATPSCAPASMPSPPGSWTWASAPARRSRSICPTRPIHPLSFFGALKCGGRIVHLSPLDAERELAFKLKDSGARILVTTNIGFMALLAQKLKPMGWSTT